MKLITFKYKNNISIGVIVESPLESPSKVSIIDLNKISKGVLPSDMLSFIEGGDEFLTLAKNFLNSHKKEDLILLEDVKILAPILNPPSLKDFFAFENHAKAGAERRGEVLSSDWYEVPAYYKGNHREILGYLDEIPWPSYTRKLDFECEIACVIGKKGKNIPMVKANDYIFGYMIFNDVSARDVQKKEMNLRMGPNKSKDFANIFGPYLVTKDEVNPKKDFILTVKVNDEVWSVGHFSDQFWGFPLLVSHVSREENIFPGDILGSGTFFKGCGLDLNRWIEPGNVIELCVEKLGTLKNIVGKPNEYKPFDYKMELIKNDN